MSNNPAKYEELIKQDLRSILDISGKAQENKNGRANSRGRESRAFRPLDFTRPVSVFLAVYLRSRWTKRNRNHT